jgi:salicylate hydroxylase
MLGDAAHASSPSQAAGAGQGLEDALILSRLLGLVKTPSQVQPALQSYDAIRRPRAQGVVQDSGKVGLAYYLLDPEMKDDLQRITADANKRLPLIWYHDLEQDISRAENLFDNLVAAGTEDMLESPAGFMIKENALRVHQAVSS